MSFQLAQVHQQRIAKAVEAEMQGHPVVLATIAGEHGSRKLVWLQPDRQWGVILTSDSSTRQYRDEFAQVEREYQRQLAAARKSAKMIAARDEQTQEATA